MLFMVIERFRDNDMLPIYKRRALQEAHRILVEIGATARAARVARELGA